MSGTGGEPSGKVSFVTGGTSKIGAVFCPKRRAGGGTCIANPGVP